MSEQTTPEVGAPEPASPPPAPVRKYHATVAQDGTVIAQGHATAKPDVLDRMMAEQGRVEITADQYAQIQTGGSWTLVNGVLTAKAAPFDLARARVAAIGRVEHEAEYARQKFLTPGFGQMLEYQATLADARAVASMEPDAPVVDTDYPWLAADIDATHSMTFREAAAAVIARASAWTIAGAAIKEQRLRAKAQIRGAVSKEAIEAIISGLRWPSP